MRTASLDSLARSYRVPLPPSRPHGERLRTPLRPLQKKPDKIDPLLKEWIRDSSGSARKRLIVSYADTVRMRRFPAPDITHLRSDPENVARRDTAQSIISGIRAARAAQFAADSLVTIARGGEFKTSFWIAQAAVVEMRLDSVLSLSTEDVVRYMEPEDSPAHLPDDESDRRDQAKAIDQINSVPFRSLGLDHGWIGLLDSGMSDHRLFSLDGLTLDESRIAGRYDYVFDYVPDVTHVGETVAHPGDPDDATDQAAEDGHGTRTMSVLIGNSSLNADDSDIGYEGVTAGSVSSYRVYYYPSPYTSYVCRYGAIEAMQEARADLEPTLVVELDITSGEESALVTAANNAFHTGASVIVAAGNILTEGEPTHVSVPGRAHKVIAVGAYDVVDTHRAPLENQRRGLPEGDNRVKPDILAPSETITASARDCGGFDCEALSFYYGGTSGATPYAAGVAALWREWLAQFESSVDPGLVYAFMILSGRDGRLLDDRGAGPIRMPSNGWAWYGSVPVEAGSMQPLSIAIPWDDAYAIEAAIWWPEDEGADHSYHKLTIRDPDDLLVSTGGDHAGSVFQRVTVGDPGEEDGWSPDGGVSAVAAPLSKGTWEVQITRAAEPTTEQQVYYAIVARALTPPDAALIRAEIAESGIDPDTGAETGDSTDTGTDTGVDSLLYKWFERYKLLAAAALAAMLLWWWRRRLWWWLKRFLGSR
jgi:hypothetical protein